MRPRYLIVLAGFVLLASAFILWSQKHKPLPHSESPPALAKPATSPTSRDPAAQLDKRNRDQAALIRSDWNDLLAWLDRSPSPSPEAVRARLLELRAKWSHLDPHVLAAMIEELLSGTQNPSLDLAFEVGPHGYLHGWPDLRTFLVDVLAVADPEESARIARELMQETNSPSEFAVAIRSLIRGGPADASEAELLSSLQTLLTRPEWQQSPAMAESLDLARYLGTPAAASLLLDWNGQNELKQMALHEFAADHPAVMMAQLDQRGMHAGEDLSALVARADPADPAQAKTADAYLRSPSVPAEHKSRFLSLYPLRSLTTGYRLYRGNPAPYDQESIRQTDRAAFQQVEQWLKDPELRNQLPALEALREELIEWMKTDEHSD